MVWLVLCLFILLDLNGNYSLLVNDVFLQSLKTQTNGNYFNEHRAKFHTNSELHPIILVGLPKSGTTSLHLGFGRLHIPSAHWNVYKSTCLRDAFYPVPEVYVRGISSPVKWNQIINTTNGCYVGIVIQKAISEGLKPLEYLIQDGYRAFTQMDLNKPNENIFIWPQIDALETLVEAYPNAYFIHTRRATDASHIASISTWNHMLDRLKTEGFLSRFPQQSINFTNFENGIIMIREFRKQIIKFFLKRPTVKFLSVTIEDENASAQIAQFLGLPSFPLEHHNPGNYNQKLTAAPTPGTIVHDDLVPTLMTHSQIPPQ